MPALNLSSSEARHIALLPKYKGQDFLARKLQLPPVNEENDLKSALLVDYFYDVLQYSANRGMPWSEVVASVHLAAEILHLSKDLSFAGAVRMLQKTAYNYVANNKLSLPNSKLLISYMTSTFLAHFKLYKYVLTHPQEENRSRITLTVEVPPQPMVLTEADTLKAWTYTNKMHEIDIDEAERKVKLQGTRNKIETKRENVELDIKMKYLEGDLQAVTLNEAEKLIAEVASTKMSLIEEDLASSIAELRDSTDVALARQAIPVPQGWENSSSFASKAKAAAMKTKSPNSSRKSSGKLDPNSPRKSSGKLDPASPRKK